MRFLKIFFATWVLSVSAVTMAGEPHSHLHHDAAALEEQGAREITIRMNDDMRFTPQFIEAKQGETVKLVVNAGNIPHELVLGPKHELLEHAKEMRQGTMHGHHNNNAITLNAGEQGEIVWVFKKAGTLDFACLIPGHYEAGMSGEVQVK
jgi:uncharacterized cupredoxin-like copper-binding protein